mmetsp:Transcript_33713/g.101790  ORF Transcript_33713/g.101790 Transcript_33713/m.101790 type:complete len:595 (-) Transcript_33713:339-2123(-)
MDTYKVYKLRVRGSYKDLCSKLGQEVYEDLARVRSLRVLEAGDAGIPHGLVMLTEEGKSWLTRVTKSDASGDVLQRLVSECEEELSKLEASLTPAQRRLRVICEGMNFKCYTSRPSWSRGAHIFVLPRVADEIEDAFEPGELGKGDLVVSPELLPDVEAAMSLGMGSRRLCAYVHEPSTVEQPLRVFSTYDAQHIREGVDALKPWLETYDPELFQLFEEYSLYRVDASSARSARLTHSTGSVPRANRALVQSWGHSNSSVARAAEEGLSLGPTAYKKFSLISAPRAVGSPQPRESGVAERGADVSEGAPDHVAWEVSTEQTAITVDTEDLQPGVGVNFGELLDKCFDVRGRPVLKSGHAFGEYMRDHFARLSSDALPPLLRSMPLESKLAPTFSGEGARKDEVLKIVDKLVKSSAYEALRVESIEMFLRRSSPHVETPEALLKAFDESVDMLVPTVAETSSIEFKRLWRAQRRSWKQELGQHVLDDGCHVVAERVRNLFQQLFAEACSNVSIDTLARSAWARQLASHRQSEKEEQTNSAGPEKSPLAGKKFKFSNRQAAGDRKAGMQGEAYQAWSGNQAAILKRPREPEARLRG